MFDVRGSRLGSFTVGEVDRLQFTVFSLPGSLFRVGNVIGQQKCEPGKFSF